MMLVGVNRSPFTRRVAITLNVYGMACDTNSFHFPGSTIEPRFARPIRWVVSRR